MKPVAQQTVLWSVVRLICLLHAVSLLAGNNWSLIYKPTPEEQLEQAVQTFLNTPVVQALLAQTRSNDSTQKERARDVFANIAKQLQDHVDAESKKNQ